MSYFGNIKRGIKTTAKGLSLTFKHLKDARFSRSEKNITDSDFFDFDKGHVTIQYPHETINVPDNGRYQLDCEIDDCIVCDKCAKICPVDCIEIEAIKSPELIRYTSDGSPVRLHAAKFDIDMAKCCFCGLCTTVCPTECLTMNSEYDYSVIDITQLNFAFANLTEEQAQEKRDLYDQFMAEKEAARQATSKQAASEPNPAARPVFRPSAKPVQDSESKPKPVFKPSVKPAEASDKPKPVFKPGTKPTSAEGTDKPKPVFRPGMKPKAEDTPPIVKSSEEKVDKPGPVFKPTLKPKATEELVENKANTKPVFRPGMKPVVPKENLSSAPEEAKAEKPKPVFRPAMKPKAATESKKELTDPAKSEEQKRSDEPDTESAKPKPVFRPTLKPKKNDE